MSKLKGISPRRMRIGRIGQVGRRAAQVAAYRLLRVTSKVRLSPSKSNLPASRPPVSSGVTDSRPRLSLGRPEVARHVHFDRGRLAGEHVAIRSSNPSLAKKVKRYPLPLKLLSDWYSTQAEVSSMP